MLMIKIFIYDLISIDMDYNKITNIYLIVISTAQFISCLNVWQLLESCNMYQKVRFF